jgi:uncharacterized membrane protein (DUF485 family)
MAQRFQRFKESMERTVAEEQHMLIYYWVSFLVTYAAFGLVFAFQPVPSPWVGSPLSTAVLCLGLAGVLITFDYLRDKYPKV